MYSYVLQGFIEKINYLGVLRTKQACVNLHTNLHVNFHMILHMKIHMIFTYKISHVPNSHENSHDCTYENSHVPNSHVYFHTCEIMWNFCKGHLKLRKSVASTTHLTFQHA